MSKILVLIRHAEARRAQLFEEDEKRQLTQHGVQQAEQLRAKLQSLPHFPQQVLSSTATRTQQTTEVVIEHLPLEAEYHKTLYNADTPALYKQLSALPTATSVVWLVGHNPGISLLASELSAEHCNLSPANAAVIALPISTWEELAPGLGTLQHLLSAVTSL
jgi:phosphohistidine phosphatase